MIARALGAALPDWVIAVPVRVAWISPALGQGEVLVRNAPAMMAIEFLVIHSAPFSGLIVVSSESTRKKVKSLLGVTFLYALCAAGIALADKSWALLGIFAAIVASRFAAIFTKLSVLDKKRLFGRSIAGALLYVVLAGVSISPLIPRLGVRTGGFGEGIWQQEPHRALFMATAYFFLLGLWEFLAARDPKWILKPSGVNLEDTSSPPKGPPPLLP